MRKSNPLLIVLLIICIPVGLLFTLVFGPSAWQDALIPVFCLSLPVSIAGGAMYVIRTTGKR